MKKTLLVCVILLVAGPGFADQLEMTHRKIHIDSQNPSRTDNYINRSSDNTQLTDPIVAAAALNNWREKTTSTLVVDKNGRGDYTTIQGAIDAINDSASTNPYVVYVMPGIYDEKVSIGSGKSYIALVGAQDAGSNIPETMVSGTIIKYASSGVGDDLMVVDIATRDGTNLGGVVLANLTIINTQSVGTGGAQAAVMIGRNDPGVLNHRVMIKDCSLYGEQDVVFLYGKGFLIMQDCYIEGLNDICSFQDEIIMERCTIYSHSTNTTNACLWMGYWDGSPMTAIFKDCTFDTNFVASSNGVGRIGHDGVTAYFYNCVVRPNAAGACWNDLGHDGVVYLYNTNGEGWPNDAVFISQQGEKISGDSTIKGGLNVGTATGAAVGEINTSGNISASGQRITAKLFDVEHYTGGLPTASSTYRGCLAFVEAGTGGNDKLYVCVKNADGSYGWDEIGQGTSESRIMFE